MWSSLLRTPLDDKSRGRMPCSVLLTRTSHDNVSLGHSLILDLCLFLHQHAHIRRVLWIRPERSRHSPAPEPIEAADVQAFQDEAGRQAGLLADRVTRDDVLRDVSIKYISGVDHLRALLANYHLMPKRSIAPVIIIEDLDYICATNAVEILALATEVLSTLYISSFLAATVTLANRADSTSKLSSFFETRIDFCDPTGPELMAILRSGRNHSKPASVASNQDPSEAVLVTRLAQSGKLIWSVDVI